MTNGPYFYWNVPVQQDNELATAGTQNAIETESGSNLNTEGATPVQQG